MTASTTASTTAPTKLPTGVAGAPSSTGLTGPGGAFAAVLQGTLDDHGPSTSTDEASTANANEVAGDGDTGGDLTNAETSMWAAATETIVVPALFTQAALPVDLSASGRGLSETVAAVAAAGRGADDQTNATPRTVGESSVTSPDLAPQSAAVAAGAVVAGSAGGVSPLASPAADATPTFTAAAPNASVVSTASGAMTAVAATSVAAAAATVASVVAAATIGMDAPGAQETTPINSALPSSTGASVHGDRNTGAVAAPGATTSAAAPGATTSAAVAPVKTMSDIATAPAAGLNPAPADAAVDAAPVAASAPTGLVSPALSATPIAPAAPAASVAPAQPVPLAPQVAAPLFTLIGAKPGEHVLTIKVTPDNLGPVTVRAHVTADNVRVELFAPNDAGRDALRAILPDLRRDLAGSGLNANLDLSSQNQAPDPEAPVPDAQRERRSTDGDPTTDQPTDARPRTFGSTSIIDVLA
jgi:flagellar hook-length control protein FliK